MNDVPPIVHPATGSPNPRGGVDLAGETGRLHWRQGDLVLGRLLVIRALAWTPSGTARRSAVFEAREAAPPWRRVAVKVSLVPALAGDEPACPPERSSARDFARAASALTSLDHPRIVRLVADASGERFPAVVLSWVDGRPFDRAVREIAPHEQLDVALQIAEVVAHAHERGVLLWDLKPADLRLARTADGPGVTLVDLDLARSGGGYPGDSGATEGWAAPEHAVADAAWIDRRADLYALGTTLYFLFTGRRLFSEGHASVREQILEDRARRAATDLPGTVAPLVEALLAPDRRSRPADAGEVLAQLRAARTGAVASVPSNAAVPASAPVADLLAQLAARRDELGAAAEQDLVDDLTCGPGDALAEGRLTTSAWRARIDATVALHAARRCLLPWASAGPADRSRTMLDGVRGALALGRLRDALTLVQGVPPPSRSAAWHALAAEIHLRLHDLRSAINHAAQAAHEPRALAVLARVAIQADDLARAGELLDALTTGLAAPPPDLVASALELEIAAFRPERALALVARLPTPDLAAQLVASLRGWLHQVDQVLDPEHRAALARTRPAAVDRPRIVAALGIAAAAALAIDARTGLVQPGVRPLLAASAAQLEDTVAMLPLGRVLAVVGRFAAGRDEDGLRLLRGSLRDGTLSRASVPVLHGMPLSDLFERKPDDRASAAALAGALLLGHLGLDDDAEPTACAAARPYAQLDRARLWIARRQPPRALAILDGLTREPFAGDIAELARRIRGVALRAIGDVAAAIDELTSVYRTRRTWEGAFWLCDALVAADRAIECLPIIDEVWRSEGADPVLAEWRIHGLLAARSYRDAIGETVAAIQRERSERPLAVLRAALQRHIQRRGSALAAAPAPAALGEAVMLAGLGAEQAALLRAIYEADRSDDNLARLLEAYRDRGDHEPRVALALQALRDRPTAAGAARVADALLDAGAAAEASALLATWLALAPSAAALWRLAGRAALAERHWDAASTAAGRALLLAPDDPVARLQLARAQLERGDPDRVAGLAQLCIAERPGDETAWNVVICAHARAGRHAAALAAARAAAAAVPPSARLQLQLAGALLRRRDLAAESAAARAVQLAPSDARAWRALILARLDQGRAAEALACCRSFEHAAGPRADVAELTLFARVQLGDFENAVSPGLDAVRDRPAHALAWESLALAWLGRDEPSEAARAVAMMQRTGRAPDRAARMAFYVGLAQDAPPQAAVALADAAVRLRPHDVALSVVRGVVVRRTTPADPGALLDLGAWLALAHMTPALSARLAPDDAGDPRDDRAWARAIRAFACAADQADQQAAIERLIELEVIDPASPARDIARLCGAAAQWPRGDAVEDPDPG